MPIGIRSIRDPIRPVECGKISRCSVGYVFMMMRLIYHFPFTGLGFSTFFPDLPEMVARGSQSLISPLFSIIQTPYKRRIFDTCGCKSRMNI